MLRVCVHVSTKCVLSSAIGTQNDPEERCSTLFNGSH